MGIKSRYMGVDITLDCPKFMRVGGRDLEAGVVGGGDFLTYSHSLGSCP